MNIGVRVKAARQSARMSQRGLADEAGVSAMAISKYERDLDVPGSAVLIRLARALDVKVEYFLRPVTVSLTEPVFRRRSSLLKKEERAIVAEVQEWLERYLDVESLFGDVAAFAWPSDLNRCVGSVEETERVALDLRAAWNLGLGPIDSLVELLEDHGIKVGLVEAHDDFDALTLWANEAMPVIVMKGGVAGDRQRFNLAHELGHLILVAVGDVDLEKAAYRFAGALLVPEQVARYELGEHRHSLDLRELHLLKHKYGLSMQAWVYRARDLGIISERCAKNLFKEFRRQGWYREEPGEPVLSEQTGRLKRLVLRALAEDLISESRAAELLGVSLKLFHEEEAKEYAGVPANLCS